MRKSSLHKKTRDCVTMTCDYDNDRFPGNAEISALDRNSHGHSQRSWSTVMVKKSRSPASKTCSLILISYLMCKGTKRANTRSSLGLKKGEREIFFEKFSEKCLVD